MPCALADEQTAYWWCLAVLKGPSRGLFSREMKAPEICGSPADDLVLVLAADVCLHLQLTASGLGSLKSCMVAKLSLFANSLGDAGASALAELSSQQVQQLNSPHIAAAVHAKNATSMFYCRRGPCLLLVCVQIVLTAGPDLTLYCTVLPWPCVRVDFLLWRSWTSLAARYPSSA